MHPEIIGFEKNHFEKNKYISQAIHVALLASMPSRLNIILSPGLSYNSTT